MTDRVEFNSIRKKYSASDSWVKRRRQHCCIIDFRILNFRNIRFEYIKVLSKYA